MNWGNIFYDLKDINISEDVIADAIEEAKKHKRFLDYYTQLYTYYQDGDEIVFTNDGKMLFNGMDLSTLSIKREFPNKNTYLAEDKGLIHPEDPFLLSKELEDFRSDLEKLLDELNIPECKIQWSEDI